MLTPSPVSAIDGAEQVVPAPATVSTCHVPVPLAAQKNNRLWLGPWTAMLALAPLSPSDGPGLAKAGASPAVAANAAAQVPTMTARRMMRVFMWIFPL